MPLDAAEPHEHAGDLGKVPVSVISRVARRFSRSNEVCWREGDGYRPRRPEQSSASNEAMLPWPDLDAFGVVVDNGSEDGSTELGYALADAGRIHFIANTTQRYHGPGLTQGVNHLSRLAAQGSSVDLVWALDTDVLILRPDVVSTVTDAIRQSGAVFAGRRRDYKGSPPQLTSERLALCSVIFDPAVVWRPEHRPFLDDGEPSRLMHADLLEAGRPLLSFPFCTRGYVLHLGRSTLAEVIRRGEDANAYHAWAKEHREPHYGGVPGGREVATRFDAEYREAAGNESVDELVALLCDQPSGSYQRLCEGGQATASHHCCRCRSKQSSLLDARERE